MENTLYALDLTHYALNGPQIEPAFSEASEEENPLIDMQGSLRSNQEALATKYPNRTLGTQGIVQTPSDLYATSVPHKFIKPQWYKPHENLRDASLAEFVAFMEEFRNESPGQNEALWQTVLNNPRIQNLMRNFRRVTNEEDLREWFSFVLGKIVDLLGELGYLHSSAGCVFGLGGALAYTDPGTGQAVDYAAYLSEVDKVFFRDRVPFAGVEFKYATLSENKLWFKVHRAALAQTLAGLGGNKNCILALFLCNFGFRTIWRKVIETMIVNGEEVKVYQNYTFPPLDPTTQAPYLRYCYSEDPATLDEGSVGMEDLIRVMMEFVLTSFVKEDEEPGTPQAAAIQPLTTSAENSAQKPAKKPRTESNDPVVIDEYTYGARTSTGEVEFLRGFTVNAQYLESIAQMRE